MNPNLETGGEVPKEISVRVGEEILNGRLEAGAWAKALASVAGNRDQAVAEYARVRIRDLMIEREQRSVKMASLEVRRLHSCLGVKTVHEILKRMNRGGMINVTRPKMPVVWLVVLMIGCAGSAAGIMRMAGPWMPEGIQPWVPLVALAGGFGLVAVLVLLSRLLPTMVLHRVWGEGVVAACSVACLASLYFGTKVLERNPDGLSRHAAAARVSPGFSNPGPESAARIPVADDVVAPSPSSVLVQGEDPR